MKSRIEGRSYMILRAGNRVPEIIKRKGIDNALKDLESAFTIICNVLEDLYYVDQTAYYIVRDEALHELKSNYYECSDSICCDLDRVVEGIREFKDVLATHNDDIKPIEDVLTLSDLGLREDYTAKGKRWEKHLEDSREKEIVEEIRLSEEGPLRLIRTIEWEATDHGRASKSIKYRKLPIGKNLMKAIINTKGNIDAEDK